MTFAPNSAPVLRLRDRLFAFNERVGLALPLSVLIVTGMLLAEPRFVAKMNMFNVLRDFSVITLAALGQMLVLVTGRFDLSVGAIVALASVTTASVSNQLMLVFPDMIGFVAVLGVLAGLSVGAIAGVGNGWLISTLKLDAFIATIATSSIILGAVFVWTYGVPVYGVPKVLTQWVGRGQIFGLPGLLYLTLVAVFIVWFVLERTAYGRHILAVGSNEAAAEIAGISPKAIICGVFAASGFFAALVGVYFTARMGSGQSALGANTAMQAITAAVIGGVSLRGGSGNPIKVMFGGLFLAVVGNALNLARVDSKFQVLVFGVVLLAAAFLDRATDRAARQEGQR
ncbi:MULTISPECIES: ABC transporter permease [Actibacterium]|uniref:Ribose transport system permease protein n=1 Tax=Actibacterium naphthalenivorans TaxID=1614693 RepID=A0A840CPW6_9RHOB|nr:MULTISPECIES: ABC transporter permease [Actibacterium]MBB4023977.1 ribose transport system permease protein [Actibacterium naphthalenivorans]